MPSLLPGLACFTSRVSCPCAACREYKEDLENGYGVDGSWDYDEFEGEEGHELDELAEIEVRGRGRIVAALRFFFAQVFPDRARHLACAAVFTRAFCCEYLTSVKEWEAG